MSDEKRVLSDGEVMEILAHLNCMDGAAPPFNGDIYKTIDALARDWLAFHAELAAQAEDIKALRAVRIIADDVVAHRPELDITKCPSCGGPADQGFSREDPPSPYYCSKCDPPPKPEPQKGKP